MIKKVCILHSGNLSDISPGGVSEYVKQFIEKSDSEIMLFGTEKNNSGIKLWQPYKRYIGEKEYTFFAINYSDRRPISIFYFLRLISFMLFHIHMIRSIDVFFAQRMEYVLPFTFLFPFKKVVMAVHGSSKYSSIFWGKTVAKIYGILELLAIKKSKKVLVLNNNQDFGVPYYKQLYKKDADKIYYVPVPVNMELFKPKNKQLVRGKYNYNPDEKIILFFGRLEHNPKRVFLLPKILKGLKRKIPKTKMLIIGSGNDKRELISRFEIEQLNNDVRLYDYLQHDEELIDLINCSDVSVVASTFEGICMSALESLSCGVPVVATNVGDIKEYLKNDKNGYLVNSQSEEEIIEDMIHYLNGLLLNQLDFDNESILKYEANHVIKQTEKLILS